MEKSDDDVAVYLDEEKVHEKGRDFAGTGTDNAFDAEFEGEKEQGYVQPS